MSQVYSLELTEMIESIHQTLRVKLEVTCLPTSLYLTAHNWQNGLDYPGLATDGILLALDIEDGYQQRGYRY